VGPGTACHPRGRVDDDTLGEGQPAYRPARPTADVERPLDLAVGTRQPGPELALAGARHQQVVQRRKPVERSDIAVHTRC